MKQFKNIIQSQVEPDKNSIWLNDGKLMYFSKQGWKPLSNSTPGGGGESSGGNDFILPFTIGNYTYQKTITNEDFQNIKSAVENRASIKVYQEDYLASVVRVNAVDDGYIMFVNSEDFEDHDLVVIAIRNTSVYISYNGEFTIGINSYATEMTVETAISEYYHDLYEYDGIWTDYEGNYASVPAVSLGITSPLDDFYFTKPDGIYKLTLRVYDTPSANTLLEVIPLGYMFVLTNSKDGSKTITIISSNKSYPNARRGVVFVVGREYQSSIYEEYRVPGNWGLYVSYIYGNEYFSKLNFVMDKTSLLTDPITQVTFTKDNYVLNERNTKATAHKEQESYKQEKRELETQIQNSVSKIVEVNQYSTYTYDDIYEWKNLFNSGKTVIFYYNGRYYRIDSIEEFGMVFQSYKSPTSQMVFSFKLSGGNYYEVEAYEYTEDGMSVEDRNKLNMLSRDGDGTKVLTDDGTYKQLKSSGSYIFEFDSDGIYYSEDMTKDVNVLIASGVPCMASYKDGLYNISIAQETQVPFFLYEEGGGLKKAELIFSGFRGNSRISVEPDPDPEPEPDPTPHIKYELEFESLGSNIFLIDLVTSPNTVDYTELKNACDNNYDIIVYGRQYNTNRYYYTRVVTHYKNYNNSSELHIIYPYLADSEFALSYTELSVSTEGKITYYRLDHIVNINFGDGSTDAVNYNRTDIVNNSPIVYKALYKNGAYFISVGPDGIPFFTVEEDGIEYKIFITSYYDDMSYESYFHLERKPISVPKAYTLNLSISSGVFDNLTFGENHAEVYNDIRSTLDRGGQIIIKNAYTTNYVEADAKDTDIIALRYSVPVIADDNNTISLRCYEIKITSTKYSTKFYSSALTVEK